MATRVKLKFTLWRLETTFSLRDKCRTWGSQFLKALCIIFTTICDPFRRNREQVARQIFLVLSCICTVLHDQYRPYSMHSARHNVSNTHSIHKVRSWATPFIIVHPRQPLVIEREFHSFCIGIPWLYRVKITCTVDSYLMRNLYLRLVPCFARAGHISETCFRSVPTCDSIHLIRSRFV